MLYRFVRPAATLAFLLTYKKIFIKNADSIPWDKPLIIAVNHPTAFIEPCILACFLPRPLHFLVRGDIWKKEFYNKLMRGVNLIPIYRQKDGYENLTKNYETFNFCYQALADRKTILLMPEGTTKQEKRLRPIKKGLARICFGALESHPGLDIHIVPLGVNFVEADKPRTEVMFRAEKPIRVLDYYDPQNPNKGILAITRLLEEGLTTNIVNIPNPEDDQGVERLLILGRNQIEKSDFPIVEYSDIQLSTEIAIANKVSGLKDAEKQAIFEKGKEYFDLLENEGLQDQNFEGFRPSLFSSFFLFITAFPAFLGWTFNIIPYTLSKKIAVKKVNQREFFMPVLLGLNIFLYLGFYLLMTLLLGLWSWKMAIAWVLTSPLLGFLYLYRKDKMAEAKNRQAFDRLSGDKRKNILEKRKELVDWLPPITAQAVKRKRQKSREKITSH